MKASQSENLGLSAMAILRQRDTYSRSKSGHPDNMDILCGYALKSYQQESPYLWENLCCTLGRHSSIEEDRHERHSARILFLFRNHKALSGPGLELAHRHHNLA